MDGNFKRTLPVKLLEVELVSRALQMADIERDVELLEKEVAELGDTQKELKERCKKRKEDRRKLGRVLRSGVEERPVECEMVRDYQVCEVSVRRLDTYEVVETRPMTAEERQMRLEDGAKSEEEVEKAEDGDDKGEEAQAGEGKAESVPPKATTKRRTRNPAKKTAKEKAAKKTMSKELSRRTKRMREYWTARRAQQGG